MFAGGGLKTGQVIGATDKEGGQVEDRMVNVKDFMATVYKAIGIDYNLQVRIKGGRPVRLVDRDPTPVKRSCSPEKKGGHFNRDRQRAALSSRRYAARLILRLCRYQEFAMSSQVFEAASIRTLKTLHFTIRLRNRS